MHGIQLSLGHLDLAKPTAATAVELLGLTVIGAAVALLFFRMAAATVFTIGIGLEIFSGNWKYMHIPLPLDRLVFLLGIVILAYRGMRRVSPGRQLLLSPIHLLFAAIVLYATLSAWGAGTLTTSLGFYALLDRLGVIPFLTFTFAPVIFGTSKSRNTLLVMLAIVGCYLGGISCLEGVGLNKLVLPSYINNPALGIHFGRARGPFLEAAANGLTMFICSAAALIAITKWRWIWARLLCVATVLSCSLGMVFTLTREVWLGAVVGILAVGLYDKNLRRRLPQIFAGAAFIAAGVLVVVPGLWHKVSSRAADSSPIWDRYNTNKAALLAWKQHPLFGIGWETFIVKSGDYLRQAGTYPLTGTGLEVHNVFLSHLVELGLFGALMWVGALIAGVVGAALRRGPAELYPWRLALIAIFACFFIVANFGPLSYPLPNLLLWLFAGIVARDHYTIPRPPLLVDELDRAPVLAEPAHEEPFRHRRLANRVATIKPHGVAPVGVSAGIATATATKEALTRRVSPRRVARQRVEVVEPVVKKSDAPPRPSARERVEVVEPKPVANKPDAPRPVTRERVEVVEAKPVARERVEVVEPKPVARERVQVEPAPEPPVTARPARERVEVVEPVAEQPAPQIPAPPAPVKPFPQDTVPTDDDPSTTKRPPGTSDNDITVRRKRRGIKPPS